MNRGSSHFTGRTALLICAWSIGALALPVKGQIEPPPTPTRPAPAQFDPSDVYFQGYLLSKEAESLQAQKKYSDAFDKYQSAQKLFDRIHTYFPTWRREMVEGRISKNQTSMDSVAANAINERKQASDSMAELEGRRGEGIIQGEAPQPLNNSQPPSPLSTGPGPDTLGSKRIQELEGKVRDLQDELRTPPPPSRGDASRDQSALTDISRQRDLAQARLKQATDELNQLRSQQLNQPVQEEMQRLSNRIAGLEQENLGTQKALSKSRQETDDARRTIEALQKERSSLAQREADLKQALETERKVQNEVVDGQQKQLRQLQDTLRAKNDELADANQRISRLEGQLDEMHQSFKELEEERDNLVRERNQMADLLKLNDSGQLRELIDQNMGLAKQLREANEKVERLNKENNETKDSWAEALNDVVVAKAAINNFKREKIAQDKRIEDLERRLRSEDKSLAEDTTADPAETDVLRKIIQKQLRQQDRRRQARETLLQAIGEKSKDDPEIASAMELFNSAEIPLTADELKIVDDRRDVDTQIIVPTDRTKEQVGKATLSLESDTVPYKKAAQRAFINERLESARELFELVAEANPGDVQAICSLGVINLKRQDPAAAVDNFRRAVELDSRNPFAQRKLGQSLMEAGAGGEAEAEIALKRSLELAPTNPAAHNLLGSLYYQTGRDKEAEESFKAAIACDDMLSQPYYNLSVLYGQQGKKAKAMESYREALNRGCEPDFELEKTFAGQ